MREAMTRSLSLECTSLLDGTAALELWGIKAYYAVLDLFELCQSSTDRV